MVIPYKQNVFTLKYKLFHNRFYGPVMENQIIVHYKGENEIFKHVF